MIGRVIAFGFLASFLYRCRACRVVAFSSFFLLFFCLSEASAHRSVGHPAAGLHLVRVEAPELQLLLEQRSAHVRRVVQLARSVDRKEIRKNIFKKTK